MQSKTVTIRLQTLDGVWETVGVDRLRGVWPENDSYTSDEFGSSKCSFDLHRDPGAIFPDLSAWTPMEVEIGGVVRWSGRIIETPDQEAARVLSVQGKGWQYHLDDDQYSRAYVRTALGDWKDARSYLNESLTVFTTAGQVRSDGGAITLGWQNGTILPASSAVGVKLDMGPGQQVSTIAVTFQGVTGAANSGALIVMRASDSDNVGPANDVSAGSVATLGTNLSLNGGDFPTPGRYVTIFLYVASGVTLNGDVMVQIRDITTASDPSYLDYTTAVVNLPASTIVTDALDSATLLLSSDRSGIEATSFSFPAFALDGQKSPREVIAAASAVEVNVTKVDVNRRMIFKPRPTAAVVEIGAWPGSEFDGASTNSGEEIYNRAIVEGTGPDGVARVAQRVAAQQPGAQLGAINSPAPDNPSFATNTTSWTPSSGSSITRDTGVFDSAPASGRWDRSGGDLDLDDQLVETFSGTFRAGVPYRLDFGARSNSSPLYLTAEFGTGNSGATTKTIGSAGFTLITVAWTPLSDTSGTTLTLTYGGGRTGDSGWIYVDSLSLATAVPTLVDRRGFIRSQTLPVQTALTAELGTKIGDVWLAAHKTTPLKGTVKVTGDRACREITTGAGIPPERLLTMTSELMRLSHRVDPDTGGQGRDGRIAEVTYTPATDTAVVALDNRRTSHEALLKRLAAVVGSG